MTVEAKYLSRDAFAERVKACPVVILPMGATEQHGYHLPLGVDVFLAEALSVRVAQQTNATVLPTMPFGYSYVWRDDPGTVTLEQHNVEAVIKDVATSVERCGVKHLILINGHEANSASMKYAARELWDDHDIKVWHIFYPGLQSVLDQICDSPTWHGIIHACEFETSLMLAIAPDLVDMTKAVKEYPPRDIGYFHGGRPMGHVSKSGVFGDASLATAEKGELLLAEFVERIVKLVEQIKVESDPV
ncbi:MAG: creatininase family protein [Rhodobacteraceae bacterium]|nr:creatininase family protein [Paracoccaceae bacterium]